MKNLIIILILNLSSWVLVYIIAKLDARKVDKILRENNHKFTDPSHIEYLHKNHTTVYGVYVIRNLQNGKVYVGQSKNAVKRSRDHLNKRGNVSIATDLSIGYTFEVMIIPLSDTNYPSLNALEKAFIKKYNSYYKGYNKTRGNN